MKTTILIILAILVLFFQFVQIGEVKKLQESRNREVEQIRSYFDLIDRFGRVVKDPSDSGVAAVVYSRESIKGMSPDAAIEFYNRLLDSTRDEAVRRALQFQIIELSQRGSPDRRKRALEMIQSLITGAPSTQPTTQPAEH